MLHQEDNEKEEEETAGRSKRKVKEQEHEERGKKRRFVYGNYDHYYGYRVLNDLGEDPRLKYLKKEWFEGKDCLDVGCNTGNLTISIAKKFLCKTMIGIDIDPGLVNRARKLLEHTAKNSPDLEANRNPNLEVNTVNREKGNDLTSSSLCDGLSGEELLRRITFRAENFIDCVEANATYDTVLCLSVTKWVHLNWGDDGLIRLFAKIRNLLRPGGILVLEPQPWKSYKNKHLVSEVVRQNFNEIVLRPDQFKEVLLDRIGYRSMERITEKIVDSTKGFSRPIFLLRC